jgi:hypothetical protein
MMKRTRLALATTTVAALIASVAASAAASGSAATPRAAKADSVIAKKGGNSQAPDGSKAAADADFAAMAADLGVTTDRLTASLVAAKRSVTPETFTPEAFVAVVAADLGLPVSRVQDVVGPMLLKPAPAGKPGKQDDTDKKSSDDPESSPFGTDAAAASVATALGVDRARAKTALAAVVRLGSSPDGIATGSKAFGDIAASLGVSSDRLRIALGDLKESLANS